MKPLATTLLFAALLLSFPIAPVIAGPGHNHGFQEAISSEQAASQASEFIARMVDAEKIDVSWADIAPSSVENKTFNQSRYWVIAFNNVNIQKPSEQTLYVFYSLYGDPLGANYTGE